MALSRLARTAGWGVVGLWRLADVLLGNYGGTASPHRSRGRARELAERERELAERERRLEERERELDRRAGPGSTAP